MTNDAVCKHHSLELQRMVTFMSTEQNLEIISRESKIIYCESEIISAQLFCEIEILFREILFRGNEILSLSRNNISLSRNKASRKRNKQDIISRKRNTISRKRNTNNSHLVLMVPPYIHALLWNIPLIFVWFWWACILMPKCITSTFGVLNTSHTWTYSIKCIKDMLHSKNFFT